MRKDQENNQPMRAILFARVSSREQELGSSIDAQMATIYDYCEKKNLPIIKEFVITESSTQGDRKQYQDMLSFVKSQKGKIAIVVNYVDRLQRSYKDTPALDELRRQGKIEVHFLKENLILHKDSNAMEIMFWNMSVLMANGYVLSIIDKIKHSQKFIWEQGRWLSQAPLGYLNTRDSHTKKATIIHDPVRASLVKKLFIEYAEEYQSLNGMVEYAHIIGLTRRNGRKLSRNEINKILHNPFYIGLMVIKDTIRPHTHGPIVDKELFDLVQDTLSGKRRVPNKKPYGSKEFTLRGIFRCKCGCTLSPELKKGKYVYLKCSHAKGPCDMKPVNEKVLLERVSADVMDALRMPLEIMQDIKGKVKKVLESEHSKDLQTKKRLENQLTERLPNRHIMQNLPKLQMNGKILNLGCQNTVILTLILPKG
ncbi:MAG: recombinase family protein [Rickettsiales bacterium]|jgi:DNA invertase Pin-like site-specific DNA recombinase|nr:recombinase family protein [Rickettsiales bacterium]